MGLHSHTKNEGDPRSLIVCKDRSEGFRKSCCDEEEKELRCLYIQNYRSGYEEEEPETRWGYDDPTCIPAILTYKREETRLLNLWTAGYDQDRFPEWFTVPDSSEHADDEWILISGPSTCYWVKWKEPGGEVCKVVIDYEPMDDECEECTFRLGSDNPGDYSWEEVNRTVSKVNRTDIDPEDETQTAGWHFDCPYLTYIYYSACLPVDMSHCDEEEDPPEEDPCDVYEETYIYDEGGENEAEYYVHFDIRDPSSTFSIPPEVVITQECVDEHLDGNPSIGTYTLNDEHPEYCRTASGNLTYTGNGSFTGDVTEQWTEDGNVYDYTYSLTKTLDCNSDLNEVVTIPGSVECDAGLWVLITTSTYQQYLGGWSLPYSGHKRNNYTYSRSFCDDESCSVCDPPFYTGTVMFSQSCSGFNWTYYWVHTLYYPEHLYGGGPYWTYETFTIN